MEFHCFIWTQHVMKHVTDMKSRFSVKQKAGNIIPAIATTNAIIAGMVVMLAIKVVMEKLCVCFVAFHFHLFHQSKYCPDG
jgi:hypothetical protein